MVLAMGSDKQVVVGGGGLNQRSRDTLFSCATTYRSSLSWCLFQRQRSHYQVTWIGAQPLGAE